MGFVNGCITLNRVCNLRCKWCYAKDVGYDDKDTMPLSEAKHIVDIFSELRVKHIKLIGGEPTLYPHLFDLLTYINYKQCKTGFLTNGIKLSDKAFVKELGKHGVSNISVSLKGSTADIFKETTGVDMYNNVIAGMENCLSLGISVAAFMVVTKENIAKLLECIGGLCKIGIKKFRFTFEYNYDMSSGYKNYIERTQPRKIVEKFKAIYEELDKITCQQIGVFPTFPACFWGVDFIEMLAKKGQLARGCPVKDRSDYIFDSKGNLIPCSAMYTKRYGQLYNDFTTGEELQAYCESEYVKQIYDECYVLPSKKCLKCTYNHICDSCSCQWTNYSFNQLMQS